MTELYKRNGAVFIPAGITLEEIEKLKDLLNQSNVRLAEEQLKNEKMKCCDNCRKYKFEIEQKYCKSKNPCKNKSEWELAE